MSRIAIQWCEIGDLDIHIADGNYSSKYPRSEEFLESGVPFIRANNLLDKSVSDKDMYFISPQKHNLLKKGHLKKNDVLVTTRGDLGKVALVPERHDDSNINAQLVLLRPNPQKVDPLFLLYCFEGSQVKGQVNQLQTGTALQQLPVGNLKKIKIPVPPLAEQRRIAAILDKADAIRRKRKQAILYTEELLRATFLDMFGDPVTNPKGWKVVALETIGRWSAGGTPSRGKPEFFVGTINWYSAGELNQRYLSGSKEKISVDALGVNGTKLFKSGSLLVGMYDTAAFKLGILKEDSASNQACASILPNSSSCHVDWLYTCFEIMRPVFLQSRKGIRQQNLSQSVIKKFEIPLPDIEKQQLFSEFVRKQMTIYHRLSQAIEESENLFKSLLKRAFRGELSV